MFDVSSRKTFEALDEWLLEASKYGANGFPCVVCGNKVDKQRVVSEKEAKTWAVSKGYNYFETSAKTGANITESLNNLFQQVVDRIR